MLTGQIIQRIQSLYNKGAQSDDSRLTRRHIYNKMKTLRSKLLVQKLKKKQKISDWSYAVLPCMEVIEVNAHECGCLPQIGCKVFRTKLKLPKPLNDMNKHIIQWVMSVEHSIKYEETTREKERYNSGNRYTKNNKRYLIENEYLYLFGGYPGVAIAVKLLVENPEEARALLGICDDTEEPYCLSPLDQDFPIDDDLIEDMITMAVPELVQMFSSVPEDLTNNSKDSNVEQAK